MNASNRVFLLLAPLTLAACGDKPTDPRGVDRTETLLSVSASGQAEARPDRAQFQAGIETRAGTARQASTANGEKIAEIVAALRGLGVAPRDIQTRTVSVQRIEYGPQRGQFQAANVVEVTLREPDKAGNAVAAVTEAGANIVSGPNLSMTDPEATANLAYADAYKAARARAEAYARAAGMEVSRVLYIRDAGGTQGQTYLRGAEMMEQSSVDSSMGRGLVPVAPPPPPQVSMPGMMVGTSRSDVYIQVDFALRAK